MKNEKHAPAAAHARLALYQMRRPVESAATDAIAIVTPSEKHAGLSPSRLIQRWLITLSQRQLGIRNNSDTPVSKSSNHDRGATMYAIASTSVTGTAPRVSALHTGVQPASSSPMHPSEDDRNPAGIASTTSARCDGFSSVTGAPARAT